MKRVIFALAFIFVFCSAAVGAPKKMLPASSDGNDLLPNIFIYAIPNDNNNDSDIEEKDAPEDAYITPEYKEKEIIFEDENSDDDIIIGASTLKGYTQYKADINAIYLNDDNSTLNIKTPQKIESSKSLNFGVPTAKKTLRYTDAEYVIAPYRISTSSKVGNFTLGAQFNTEVDNIAMLETETGLFTKYEKNRFALSSSVTKSLNTTYYQDYNTFSLAPEIKLNNYMSLKNVFSADVTRNKRSSKLIFSFNPFGKKDNDRMFFEFGAKETYNADTDTTSTQFTFSTQLKL